MSGDFRKIDGFGQNVNTVTTILQFCGRKPEKRVISSIRSSGFVRDPKGNFTTFDVPNASFTSAFGINDRGDIVGLFTDSSFRNHGFLMENAPGAAPSLRPVHKLSTTWGEIKGKR